MAQTAGKPEKTVFDFNRVSQDLTNFTAMMNQEQFERDRLAGREHNEENDLIEDSQIDKIFASTRTDKEAEEEFEELWQGATVDLYRLMRDDLKSQYEQARILMKLNQQLRNRLMH